MFKALQSRYILQYCPPFYHQFYNCSAAVVMPLPTTPKRHRWTGAERHEIQDYAREHATEGLRVIKHWYESQYPAKALRQSQISIILHPKRPRGPSDVDPHHLEELKPESKLL